MKKAKMAVLLLALMLLLSGCGVLVVEDAAPVVIGWSAGARLFT